MTVTVLGIRHHGPGSARSVERALRELEPDAVLVEGPPEAEPLLALAAHDEMQPPVALLAYAVDEPSRASFYPFARFSPEWAAIRHALATGATLRMIDLPLTHVLAEAPAEHAGDEGAPDAPDDADEAPTADGGTAEDDEPGATEDTDDVLVELWRGRDPIRLLAEAAGHGDPERFWEDVVEHRDGEQAFPAIADAMAALRELEPRASQHPFAVRAREQEARREAAMRQAIRQAQKDGHERIAVVCGAWHAPALQTLGPAAPDAALLRRLPRRKVAVTWVPWTYQRLSFASGYGAGVTSPGWYEHLYDHHGDRVLIGWLAKTAALLRGEDLDVSAGHVIEAVRLAEALATLRLRPLAGLPELTDATRAILGDGADAALSLVHDRLIVGEVLGTVPADAPTVPLQADLEREQRRLRLRPEAGAKTLDLDLRRDIDRDRSRLLHRLRLLGVPWGEPAHDTRATRGTFHEIWGLQWQPEFIVRLVEASRYGSRLPDAATALVVERADGGAPLDALTGLIEAALLADLPAAVTAAMTAFQARAAVGADTAQLMDALVPLARVLRYGNVRDTDTGQVEHVVDGLVARIVVGLGLAAGGLDDAAAAEFSRRVDAVDGALGLLARDDLRGPWRDALARLAIRTDVHGLVTGRITRILHDAGLLDRPELARRVSLALSRGNDPAAAAAWLEGCLGSSGVVLLHDDTLLRLLDAWLAGVSDDAFTQLLPVLRRTFATFPAGERRQLGQRVRRLGDGAGMAAIGDDGDDEEPLDRERVDLVLPVLALIVGEEAAT